MAGVGGLLDYFGARGQTHGAAGDDGAALVADMERAGIETIHTLTDLPQKEIIAVPFSPVASEKADRKDEGKEPQSKKA